MACHINASGRSLWAQTWQSSALSYKRRLSCPVFQGVAAHCTIHWHGMCSATWQRMSSAPAYRLRSQLSPNRLPTSCTTICASGKLAFAGNVTSNSTSAAMMQQLQAAMAANASSAVIAPLTYSIPLNFFNASLINLNATNGAAAAGANTTNSTAFGTRRLLAGGTVALQAGFESASGPRCEQSALHHVSLTRLDRRRHSKICHPLLMSTPRSCHSVSYKYVAKVDSVFAFVQD